MYSNVAWTVVYLAICSVVCVFDNHTHTLTRHTTHLFMKCLFLFFLSHWVPFCIQFIHKRDTPQTTARNQFTITYAASTKTTTKKKNVAAGAGAAGAAGVAEALIAGTQTAISNYINIDISAHTRHAYLIFSALLFVSFCARNWIGHKNEMWDFGSLHYATHCCYLLSLLLLVRMKSHERTPFASDDDAFIYIFLLYISSVKKEMEMRLISTFTPASRFESEDSGTRRIDSERTKSVTEMCEK